jgi:hypothetical protein
LCVIYKPREKGGSGPLGSVAPKTKKQNIEKLSTDTTTFVIQTSEGGTKQ